MPVHVALTPAEEASAEVGIVVDVIRATSSIAQALAAGYERVLCCREIERGATRCARSSASEAVVGGERNGLVVEGFDVGASPRAFAAGPQAPTLILSTTNGTAAILAAAARCETVLVGSLLNLAAVAGAARALGGEVAIFCAGFKGAFALDDAYCAGRIVAELEGERSDGARAAELLAAIVPECARGPERAQLRAARARGRHRVLRARERAPDGAALLAHGRCRRRNRRLSAASSPRGGARSGIGLASRRRCLSPLVEVGGAGDGGIASL